MIKFLFLWVAILIWIAGSSAMEKAGANTFDMVFWPTRVTEYYVTQAAQHIVNPGMTETN